MLSCLRYCKSTIFQANHNANRNHVGTVDVVCDTAKVRFFKQITTTSAVAPASTQLFAILQKYDFSSKSQHTSFSRSACMGCLRYCKSTIFQANHNLKLFDGVDNWLFAILQKYDFSSKSQLMPTRPTMLRSCLRYCKSTIFQANHNFLFWFKTPWGVVCDTAKVRFFKQITTCDVERVVEHQLFAILQKYDFSSKSQRWH